MFRYSCCVQSFQCVALDNCASNGNAWWHIISRHDFGNAYEVGNGRSEWRLDMAWWAFHPAFHMYVLDSQWSNSIRYYCTTSFTLSVATWPNPTMLAHNVRSFTYEPCSLFSTTMFGILVWFVVLSCNLYSTLSIYYFSLTYCIYMRTTLEWCKEIGLLPVYYHFGPICTVCQCCGRSVQWMHGPVQHCPARHPAVTSMALWGAVQNYPSCSVGTRFADGM
jgi:hypothetical protein